MKNHENQTEDNRHGRDMLSPFDLHVNSSGETWVRCKGVLQSKAPFYTSSVALDYCYQEQEYHLGSRWYDEKPTEENPGLEYRYWAVLDFDDKEDPKGALKEAYNFVLSELNPLGLKAGKDFCVAVSGTKGAKIFFLWLSPKGSESAQVWGAYLESLSPSYPSLDVQTAWLQTVRGPWSRHPKDKSRWQTVLQKNPSVFVSDPEWSLAQTLKGDRPAYDGWRASLPKLTSPSPAFLSLWDKAMARWMEKKVSQATERPRKHYSSRKVDIGAVLTANGIGHRECVSWTGERYWRLSSCMFCGAKGKAAIKERSGFYDCYRGSCDATSGLSLSRWTDGLDLPESAKLKSTGGYTRSLSLRSRVGPKRVSLLEARTTLLEAVSQCIDSPDSGTKLIRCTPGLGKSHSVLSVITDRIREAYQHGDRFKVVVATQTRELAKELLDRTHQFDFPLVVKRVFVEGRNEKNCVFPRQIKTIGALGWSPGKAFCPNCPYMGECEYYRRVKDASDRSSVVFTTHEQATALIDNEVMKPDYVIFDEDPLRSMEHRLRLGLRDIRKATRDRPEPVEHAGALLLSVMESCLPLVPPNGSIALRGVRLVQTIEERWKALEIHGYEGWEDLMLQAVAFGDILEPTGGVLAGASTATIRALLPRNFFRLMEQLIREAKRTEDDWNSPCRLVVTSSGVIFWQADFRMRPSTFLPDMVLDAYGDKTLYENLYGSEVEQIHIRADLSRSKWYYAPVRTSREALGNPESAAWKELDRVIESLSKAGSVLVGTYLAYSQAVKKRYPGVDVYHFGRGRGIDTYGGVDSVVIFGVPQPPEEALKDRATFYFQDDSPLLSFEKDPSNPRLYADPRVQRTMDAMRESEAAQVAHRVRPVNAPRTVVCIGMVDYPSLPEPSPFPRNPNQPHIDAMEAWVRDWYEEHGWWTPALIGEGECPVQPIPKRYAAKLWRKIFPTGRKSLSPDPRLSARPVWGDREKAREWARQIAKDQGLENWESI